MCDGKFVKKQQNLRAKYLSQDDEPWVDCFAVVLWMIWNWRNEATFENKELSIEDKIEVIKSHMQEIRQAFSLNNGINGITDSGSLKWVNWKLPRRGWLKLNTDGSSKAISRKAGAGGCLFSRGGRVMEAGNWSPRSLGGRDQSHGGGD